jgi:hypothetical protein
MLKSDAFLGVVDGSLLSVVLMISEENFAVYLGSSGRNLLNIQPAHQAL